LRLALCNLACFKRTRTSYSAPGHCSPQQLEISRSCPGLATATIHLPLHDLKKKTPPWLQLWSLATRRAFLARVAWRHSCDVPEHRLCLVRQVTPLISSSHLFRSGLSCTTTFYLEPTRVQPLDSKYMTEHIEQLQLAYSLRCFRHSTENVFMLAIQGRSPLFRSPYGPQGRPQSLTHAPTSKNSNSSVHLSSITTAVRGLRPGTGIAEHASSFGAMRTS
jgi:hypothetical protein